MTESSNIDAAIAELVKALGDRLTTDADDLSAHAHDASHHCGRLPRAVAFPAGNSDVVAIVDVCRRHRVAMVPYGTGTGVEGGIVPGGEAICIALSAMSAIIGVYAADRYALVQAGVTRKQLNARLAEMGTGLEFPVDPAADASLGGMAATCASGSAAVSCGTMRVNALGLTAVMADGRLIHTGGAARKSAAGYDLTQLLVGSEGTLGIITEVIVNLVPRPPAVSAAVCAFDSIENAIDTVIDVFQHGITMARIELLDDVQMAAVNAYSHLDCDVAPTLFLEVRGTPAAVVEQSGIVETLAQTHGGRQFQWSTDVAERERLWRARHDAYLALLAMRSGSVGYVTDVCVPVSRLADSVAHAKAALSGCSIPAAILGHVGDGHFHVVFLIDPEAPAELETAQVLGRQFVEHALAAGGTCSGEHGIGFGKLDALEREHGEGVEVMRQIKSALDPLNIMNPGKVLRA